MKKLAQSAALLAAFFLHLIVSPLEWAGHLWHKLVLKDGAGIQFGPPEVYASVLDTAAAVRQRNFPGADRFEPEAKELTDEDVRTIEEEADLTLHPFLDRKFVFYAAEAGDQILGYSVEDTVAGKWGPIHYMVTFDPEGSVTDVTVLEYRERRGKPVAKNRFLKQFIGKKAGDSLTLQKDIQGVTGASISSRGMTDGVRKLIYVFKHFHGS